jgi:N-acetylglutamate synthase-like GNAT family acetyltransferase
MRKQVGTMPNSLEITEAATPDDFRAAGDMILAFLAWNRQRLGQDWPREAFEIHERIREDVTNLESRNVREGWRVYLARIAGELVGCAAIRPLTQRICELKRLFVMQHFQRIGIGRRLCDNVIVAARALGYEEMKLDTADVQVEALGLFEELGFQECAPYKSYPPQVLDRVVFMQKAL